MRRKKKPDARLLLRQAEKQAKTDKITKIVAILFAFASVYYFFIKLLFL